MNHEYNARAKNKNKNGDDPRRYWNVDHYSVLVTTAHQGDGEMCEGSEMDAKDN